MRRTFTIRSVSAAETRPLRHEVLWPHKPTVESCVLDADDEPHAHHVGAFDSDLVLVGVCSLFEQRSTRFPAAFAIEVPVYRLRVMGTRVQVRGQGVGNQIMDYACHWSRQQGAQYLWCDAREVAFDFYQRNGFEFISDMYVVDSIGNHRMMSRAL